MNDILLKLEMLFYEKIGIRQFKKFVLWLKSKTIPDSKDRRGGNYYLYDISIESVKEFKKMLWQNALIHIFPTLLCGQDMINGILKGNIISFDMFLLYFCFLISLYCVLLQRYNWLRIKKILNKVAYK